MKVRYALILSVFALAGCGSDGEKDTANATATASATAKAEPTPTEEPTTAEGRLGDTLETRDDYESDGNPVDEQLKITVSAFKARATTNDQFADEFLLEKGYRWVRAKVRVRQEGSTKTEPLVEQFVAVDADDQTYEAFQAAPFKPSLTPNNNAIKIAPGKSRQGFIGFQVPKKAKIVAIQFSDSGFGPLPDFAEWRIR